MANGMLEAIDRKAALVPAALGVVAGIFIGDQRDFTVLETAVLLGALVGGIASVFMALLVLRTQLIKIGPNAATVAKGTHLDPADFNNAVAGSLALSIGKLSTVAEWKSKRQNRSFACAAATILLLAVFRIIGGVT